MAAASSASSNMGSVQNAALPNEVAIVNLTEAKDSLRKLTKFEIPCCSICLDETKREKVRTLCTCHRLVHLSCLEKWLEASHSNRCEICKHKFHIQIEKRYSKPVSVVVWLTRVHSKTTLMSDLLQLTTIGFLIGLGIFIIIKSFYDHRNIDSTSRLISAFSATIMVLITGTAFAICLYASFQQYRTAWYNWYIQCNKVSVVFTPTASQCMNVDGTPCCMECGADTGETVRDLPTNQTDFTTLCVFSM